MTRILARAVSVAALVMLAAASTAAASTFTVNDTGDAGDANEFDGLCATATGVCTLRAAVDAANDHSGNDDIVLPEGTFDVSGATGDDDNASGDIDINDGDSTRTTITGAGARATTIAENGTDRVLETHDPFNELVAISGVTIKGGGGVDEGGGIFGEGPLALTDVTIDDNRADAPNATADQGGGLFLNDSADLRNVTISNNQAVRAPGSTFGPQGGGVFDNGSPPSTWTNVTVSGNQATGSGSQGGGIFYNADANTATYTNVTVAGNSSDGSEGGGIFVNDELTWGNTIFTGNTAAGAKSNCFLNDTLHSAGHNIEDGTDCGLNGPGDRQTTDPRLDALKNNGGPVDTRALLAGSPAIDTGDAGLCPPTDARGAARPQGGGCDVGAFEVGDLGAPPPPPPPPPASGASSSNSGTTATTTVQPVAVLPPLVAVPTPTRTIGPAGNPLGLPSNRSCIDRRKFSFRLRRPQGRVVDVVVFVNGRRTKHVAGENITRLTIAKLPNRGRFRVKIVATSANGTKLVSKRTYRVCTKSKPKGKRVHPKR